MADDERPPAQDRLESLIDAYLQMDGRVMRKHGYKIPGEEIKPGQDKARE